METQYYKAYYNSPLGRLTIVCDDNENILGLWFEGQKYYLGKYNNPLACKEFKTVTKWLNRYFNKEKPNINELNLKPEGSEFRKEVWNILRNIPYGKCITYGDIAKELSEKRNCKMSAQAVGNAVAHNPISIIIPCHRVIGQNGKLTGFAAGIETKINLLKHEGYL